MLVPAQRCLFRPGRHVPELHRVVITSGRKHLAVMAEGDGSDRPVMPESRAFLASRHVPKLDRVVMTAGRYSPAVGRIRQGPDHVGVALECRHLLAYGPIPEFDSAVIAAGGQILAIG